MEMSKRLLGKSSLLMLSVLFLNTALAGGFEKNVMWSGKHAGKGGAAVSTADGAEALYFNPARLTEGADNQNISINISPTSSQYKGPFATTTGTTDADSTQQISPILGLLYQYKVNESLGLGIGYYVSGGTSVTYEDVPVSAAVSDDFATALSVTEFSIGAGYKIDEHWSAGLAWRLSQVEAEFKSGSVNAPNLRKLEYTDLKAQNTAAFRLGVSYSPSDDWGLGLSYRSAVPFTASGKASLDLKHVGTGVVTPVLDDVDTEVASQLPWQLSFGGHLRVSENWTLLGELTQTNYAALQEFNFETDEDNTDFTLDANWKNQTNVRLAGVYWGWKLPLQLGYVYTTAVVPKDDALPTFSTPDIAHSVSIGTGSLVAEKMSLHAAVEYSMASVEVSADEATEGTYSTSALALHLGLSIGF